MSADESPSAAEGLTAAEKIRRKIHAHFDHDVRVSQLSKTQKALDVYLEEMGGLTCPLCGGDAWSIVGLTDLPIKPQPEYSVAHPVVPAAIVSCNQCSRLEFFGTRHWNLDDE